jgi:Mn-dependent DtxR family transcriptional regulator
MGVALNAFTSIGGFAPSVRAEPTEGLSSQRDFVRRQRARRASWSAIAGMLGVSEPAIRRAFDPDYSAPSELHRGPASAANDRRPPLTGPALLDLLAERPMSLREIAEETATPSPQVADMLQRHKDYGRVSYDGGRGVRSGLWALTEHGSAELRLRQRLLTLLLAGPSRTASLAARVKCEGRFVANMLREIGRMGLVRATAGGRGRCVDWAITDAGRKLVEARQ